MYYLKENHVRGNTDNIETYATSMIEETIYINKIDNSPSFLKWNFNKICQLSINKDRLDYFKQIEN